MQSLRIGFIFSLAVLISQVFANEQRRNQVLLISLDGFRHDYYERYRSDLTSLTRIANNGVHAINGIKSMFTTRTFPVHWSIATGLYQENHGVVNNGFYDPIRKDVFSPKKMDNSWLKGEPIWSTAVRQNRRAGIFYWFGSEMDMGVFNATERMMPYKHSATLSERFAKAFDWLTGADGKEAMDLVMVYWHEPDYTGHLYGPFKEAIHKELLNIDQELNILLDKIENCSSSDKINIIILSDHGMEDFIGSVYLDDYMDCDEDLEYLDENPVAHLFPKAGQKKQILEKLSKLDNHKAKAYAREDLPERWRYKHNERIGEIVVVAESGYIIQKDRNSTKDFVKKSYNKEWAPLKGDHGFDNDLMAMRPLFFASGPGFKKDYSFLAPFELVDVNPLVCELLDIKAAEKVDGKVDKVSHLLRK